MELFYCAAIIALAIYMLDFGFGHPSSDHPNTKALLAFWPLFLAKKALQKAGVWADLYDQYTDQIMAATNGLQIANIKKQFKQMVLQQGKDLFTWQHFAGICPICTHFWPNLFFISLVNIFFLKENIIIFMLTLLLGHLIIRVLSKYL